jgi:site-specific recombinase XerD
MTSTILALEDARLERDDFGSRLASFVLHLRAGNKAPNTIDTYGFAIRDLAAFCESQGVNQTADVRRQLCEAYLRDVTERHSPSTARNRLKQLWGFFTWREELFGVPSPLDGIPQPNVVEEIPPCLNEEELSCILRACSGDSFEDLRDRAILRMFIDTGMRRMELLNMDMEKLDLATRQVIILGKGGFTRIVPFGQTAMGELGAYLGRRAPAGHGYVWTEEDGGRITRHKLQAMVRKRGRQAGVRGLHCHTFRHTFAHMWLASGGEEVDLMRIGGWRTRYALRLYGRAMAQQRAVSAHERHGPGDRVKA